MYSTCLFCSLSLGSNEVVEELPIGRRLAFDGARGRLWVVCGHCRRWNLTPIEERWEAIERCERLFRSTPLRVSTDNVGLTRLREGLELVRIGSPHRPEFAAWRYLPIFERRRLSNIAAGGLTSVASKHNWGSFHWVTTSLILFPPALAFAGFAVATDLREFYRRRLKTYAQVTDRFGRTFAVKGHHLADARLVQTDSAAGWSLEVDHEEGRASLAGPQAERILGRILVAINGDGGTPLDLQRAVGLLGRHDGVGSFLDHTATATDRRRGRRYWFDDSLVGAIKNRAPSARLALEMALHETTERAALDGELQSLADAWREAEEVAAIADSL
jgi:hypothetical protein